MSNHKAPNNNTQKTNNFQLPKFQFSSNAIFPITHNISHGAINKIWYKIKIFDERKCVGEQ